MEIYPLWTTTNDKYFQTLWTVCRRIFIISNDKWFKTFFMSRVVNINSSYDLIKLENYSHEKNSANKPVYLDHVLLAGWKSVIM